MTKLKGRASARPCCLPGLVVYTRVRLQIIHAYPDPARPGGSNAFARRPMAERLPGIFDEVMDRNPDYPPARSVGGSACLRRRWVETVPQLES
jgi:hypothetical protein